MGSLVTLVSTKGDRIRFCEVLLFPPVDVFLLLGDVHGDFEFQIILYQLLFLLDLGGDRKLLLLFFLL